MTLTILESWSQVESLRQYRVDYLCHQILAPNSPVYKYNGPRLNSEFNKLFLGGGQAWWRMAERERGGEPERCAAGDGEGWRSWQDCLSKYDVYVQLSGTIRYTSVLLMFTTSLHIIIRKSEVIHKNSIICGYQWSFLSYPCFSCLIIKQLFMLIIQFSTLFHHSVQR
jgi:hypothetical protein